MTVSTSCQAFCEAHTRVLALMGTFMFHCGSLKVISSHLFNPLPQLLQYCTSTPLASKIVVFMHIISCFFFPTYIKIPKLDVILLTFIFCCFSTTQTNFYERQPHTQNSPSGNGQVRISDETNSPPPLPSGRKYNCENIEREKIDMVALKMSYQSLKNTIQCCPGAAWAGDGKQWGKKERKKEGRALGERELWNHIPTPQADFTLFYSTIFPQNVSDVACDSQMAAKSLINQGTSFTLEGRAVC